MRFPSRTSRDPLPAGRSTRRRLRLRRSNAFLLRTRGRAGFRDKRPVGLLQPAPSSTGTQCERVCSVFLNNSPDSLEARAALVRQVPGLGMKEASHFLRNIGRGNRVAVLDVHLRRFMTEMGIVNSRVASSGSPASYSSMEREFTSLAFNSGLDPAALDLAIWEFMRER